MTLSGSQPVPTNSADTAGSPDFWPAPAAGFQPLQATVEIPGSKSLSNRYLILAALSSRPTTIRGLLLSRDTELMMRALQALGVAIEPDAANPTTVRVIPPVGGRFRGNVEVFCGLAGTVMRFVPGLALFADGPVHFSGDAQASARPMQPLLDGLEQLGAQATYEGEPGRLPFTVNPPAGLEQSSDVPAQVEIDSSASSQFISGLLLISSRLPGGLSLRHTGEGLPSLPHIQMTMADIAAAGGQVSSLGRGEWRVAPAELDLPDTVVVEPDLSNAVPFLGAALLAGGSVSVPLWPVATTQPGGLVPDVLRAMGAEVSLADVVDGAGTLTVSAVPLNQSPHALHKQWHDVRHSPDRPPVEAIFPQCKTWGLMPTVIHGLGDFDASTIGEIVPSLAALALFADRPTEFHGIAHLRGHETNRLAALVEQITGLRGYARELDDGLLVQPVDFDYMVPQDMKTYADHRMATFAAMVGLRIPGVRVENIGTTAKTLPDFVGMWTRMLAAVQPADGLIEDSGSVDGAPSVDGEPSAAGQERGEGR